jgi:hypothetical protein
MDVGHQKIGRKMSDLRSQKARAEQTTPEGITTNQEAVIQVGAKAGAEIRTDLCIACFMREIQTIG